MGDPLPAVTEGGLPVDLSEPLCLAPAEEFAVGELVFVSVEDPGQNADPELTETAAVTVTAATDSIALVLKETGPDTGLFVGYVPSAASDADPDDAVLSLKGGLDLEARYQDAFDAEEVSVAVAGVQRLTRIFDAVTGEPLNGVTVSILDADTLTPAEVAGPLGQGGWPATVTTGSTVSVPNGSFELAPGAFRFPYVTAGTYLLKVDVPEGYRAPSAMSRELAPEGYVIGAGSYLDAFTVTGGSIRFDVPIDPVTKLRVEKTADVQRVKTGGLVGYEVSVRNEGEAGAILALRDLLPVGFRVDTATVHRDGLPVAATFTGREVAIEGGILSAGESARFTYAARVSGEAPPGTAINLANVVDGLGNSISNTARARVRVEEDRLAVRTQIVGRVAADRCDPDDPWPRRLSDGVGVPGVRLLMETGAYVVSDRDGLFSFADVSARTHVVRLDETSLPQGYEVVVCDADTRSAGKAASRFVDAQGGMVTRANFSVRRTDGRATASDAFEATTEGLDEAVGYAAPSWEEFGLGWLDQQETSVAFAYPPEGFVPDTASVDFGLLHPRGAEVSLYVNGTPVNYAHMAERLNSTDRTKALSSFRGVALEEGENRLSAVVRDGETKLELGQATRSVWFVREAARAELIEDKSVLVADGRTVPVLALRLSDAGGRPVHAGRLVEVSVEPPHGLLERVASEEIMPIGTPQRSAGKVSVGADGIMLVRLAPTTVSGLVEVDVPTALGERRLTAVLSAAARDWIVVGLGNAVSGEQTNAVGVHRDDDARLAAYAQGTLGAGWLFTAAIDTAKDEDEEAGELLRQVDPDDRYALYGDRSTQRFDAQSRYPIFLRAERGGTKAMVGDFDTGLSETVLGRYDRRLTGAQAVHRSGGTTLTAFAAETDQLFQRDELAADGTSGPYRVRTRPIVVHSEVVTIETRDLFRPDIVLGTRTLTRFADYDLDYDTGELVFTAPVNAGESLYDTNVIVVTYEAESGAGGAVTAGGRASQEIGRATFGATIVREGADRDRPDGVQVSADGLFQLTETTLLRAEMAATRPDGGDEALAILFEGEHASDRIVGKAWFQEVEAGFGLGQQSSARVGQRRYGVSGEVTLSGPHSAADDDDARGRRARYALRGQVNRQEEIGGAGSIDVGEVSVVRQTDDLRLSLGLRGARELRGESDRKSLMLTNAVRRSLPKWRAAVTFSHDQPLTVGADDAPTLYPRRTAGEIEKAVGDFATLSLAHEILKVGDQSSANTIFSAEARPWLGATLRAGADMMTQDAGSRVGATFGADQQVPLTKRITASLNLARRVALDGEEPLVPVGTVARDAVASPLEDISEFVSAALGLAYRSEAGIASARVEFRDSAIGKRVTQIASAAREVSARFSLGATARFSQNEGEQRGGDDIPRDRNTAEVTLGAAWRPRGEGAIVLHRLDYDEDQRSDGISRTGLSATTAVSMQPAARLDFSFMHGIRYQKSEQRPIGGDGSELGVAITAEALSQVGGAELRVDLTKHVDIGVRGSVRYDHEDDSASYSYGPSVGLSPAEGSGCPSATTSPASRPTASTRRTTPITDPTSRRE